MQELTEVLPILAENKFEIVPLELKHVPDVARLAREYYSDGFQMSEDEIRSNLVDLEPGDQNFCFALEDRDELVGYLFGWVANTLVEGVTEDVALLEDMVLARKARGYVVQMIWSMITEMNRHGLQGMPIEGAVRGLISRVFLRHDQVFRKRLGYFLAAIHEYHDDDIGEDLVWVRFEAVRAPG